MPVKYWSFAGLMLTYWCNARCASCYVCSGPAAGAAADMTVEDGLAFWEGLQSASPHGCRIHIGGGEPFGRWDRLIELARRARLAGLGPLEAVETNAFWAVDDGIIRDRIEALDDAGMIRLAISSDPYHQQFVPIERVRRLASIAGDMLGVRRVRVRWRDWAEEGFDTGSLAVEERRSLFRAYALRRRDRLAGRAAVELAGFFQPTPVRLFADSPCRNRLLRSRHVHVDAGGIVCPGTCAGVMLGLAHTAGDVGGIWRNLRAVFADIEQARPSNASDVLEMLVLSGPLRLMRSAEKLGYAARPGGFAGRCHLCWDVRRWLFKNGHFRDRLGPAAVYGP